MSCLLFLLFCTEVLGAPGPNISTDSFTTSMSFTNNDPITDTKPFSIVLPTTRQAPSSINIQSVTTGARSTDSPRALLPTTKEPTVLEWFHIMFNKKDCRPVLLLTGGLMVTSTILLVSTLLLACKVCRLSRRIKALSSNAELISSSEYRVESAQKNEGKSETDPKETSILMADLGQTQEEMGNSTAKEEEGKASEDEQTGEKGKKEAGDDAAKGEEAPTTPVDVAEDSPCSKPQAEVTDPQPTNGVAASTSGGTDEPKEVV